MKGDAFVLQALGPGRYQMHVSGLASGEECGPLPRIVEVMVGGERYVEFDVAE